jgi:hypothetical protein
MAKMHPLDEMAQELYDGLQSDADFLQAALAGPTSVGTRKLSSAEWAKKLVTMQPEAMRQLMAQHVGSTSPIFKTALDQLGAHGMSLLPYLQPGALTPPTAVQPTSGGGFLEELFGGQ